MHAVDTSRVHVCRDFYVPKDEALAHYLKDEKFLVHGWSVYQIFWSPNTGVYMHRLYIQRDRHGVPLTHKGYYTYCKADHANKLIGHEMFVD